MPPSRAPWLASKFSCEDIFSNPSVWDEDMTKKRKWCCSRRTLRSCVRSFLSSFGERRVVRDSLLPDSPRVNVVPKPEAKQEEFNGAVEGTELGMVCVCVYLWVWRCSEKTCETGNCWVSEPDQEERRSSERTAHLIQTHRSLFQMCWTAWQHVPICRHCCIMSDKKHWIFPHYSPFSRCTWTWRLTSTENCSLSAVLETLIPQTARGSHQTEITALMPSKDILCVCWSSLCLTDWLMLWELRAALLNSGIPSFKLSD